MHPFRATLLDDAGQAIGDVEGSTEELEETPGACQGNFECPETEELMQAVLDGKIFQLNVEDGSPLSILIESASVSAKPGFTTVKFSTVPA